MSNKIHFFTDLDLLEVQTPEQAFGPVVGNETTQYRVTNILSATENTTPNAYAICKGQVLVQQTTDNNFSIILKPETEATFKEVPVLYFIYKGIINYNVVDSPINKQIEKNDDDDKENYSGIGYSPSATEERNQRFDNDSLISFFNKKDGDYRPINVNAGDILGEFSTSHIELQIVLGSVYYEPKLTLARTIGGESEIIDIELVENDVHKRHRKREEILNFMDVAAFYGMFIQDSIKTKTGTFKKPTDIYNNILIKFHNRNKIYFDIRDERGFSFNYHRDKTVSNIRCYTDYVQNYTNQHFIDNTYEINPDWPILILDSTNYNINATNFQIRLSLKTANGQGVHIYSVNSYWFYDKKDRPNKKLRSNIDQFKRFSFDTEEEKPQPEFTNELIFASLLTPTNSNTQQTIAAYYKILTTDKHNSDENYDYLFPIKPFDEYDYFYDPNLKMQAWLIQHETFLNSTTVVNSGVALDYDNQRITFFACPPKANKRKIWNNKKTTIDFLQDNTVQSFYKKCFEKGKKESQITKICRQIEYSPNNSNIVDLLKAVSTIDFISISIERNEFIEKIESNLNNFDSYISPVFVSVVNLTERIEAQGSVAREQFYFTPMALEGYTNALQEATTQINDFVLYSCDDTLPLIITTQKAAHIENIEPNTKDIDGLGARGFIIEVNDIGYYSDIIPYQGRTIEEECAQEAAELKQALEDIKKHNQTFYENISQLLYHGIAIRYPDGITRPYFPAIHIRFAKINYNGLFSIDPLNAYEEGTYVIIQQNGIDVAVPLIALDEASVNSYIELVNTTLTPLNPPVPFNVEWNYEYFWRPQESQCMVRNTINEEMYVPISLRNAEQMGKAVLRQDLTIQLSLQQRCNLDPQDYVPPRKEDMRPIDGKQPEPTPIKGYSDRKFFNARLLTHELGHVYGRVGHMLEGFLWGQLEQTLESTVIDGRYQHYRNTNIANNKGHLLGNPSGIRAVAEEIKFMRTWHTYYFKEITNKTIFVPNSNQNLPMCTYIGLENFFIMRGGINGNEAIERYEFNNNNVFNRRI
ncbi:MAG: hypothetical protein FWC41_02735 [Firmicutes bacterium]|nr:hypothetical protein [Bacillota bacterium]